MVERAMADHAPLLDHPDADVQARRPATHLSLSRVGVTGVSKTIRLRPTDHGPEALSADLECYVDLNPRQKGVHMSRFGETVEQAIDAVVLDESFRAETLAAHVAERVRDRQGALRAEVRLSARYAEERRAPASGSRTQETHTLHASAVAGPAGTRRVVGVETQGMTACPCAQELVAARARQRLEADGFSDAEIERVFEHVPVATHNQRGLGTLWVGTHEGAGTVDTATLLEIIEASMSSETYELMKRADEVEVVERAHRRPRFVEDCVREMVRLGVEAFAGLGDEAFLMARQVNFETIHHHEVIAERYGLIGELGRELGGEGDAARHTSMREWLEGAGGTAAELSALS
jgi:GTP cyclohydrolase I/GTP cyclohydrolase-4